MARDFSEWYGYPWSLLVAIQFGLAFVVCFVSISLPHSLVRHFTTYSVAVCDRGLTHLFLTFMYIFIHYRSSFLPFR